MELCFLPLLLIFFVISRDSRTVFHVPIPREFGIPELEGEKLGHLLGAVVRGLHQEFVVGGAC
jgi:hypothetical protein